MTKSGARTYGIAKVEVMDFHQLEMFIAIVEERSFSRAAEKLLRTQPAISAAIRKLESEFGEKLFDRTPKGTLTSCGEVFYEHAVQILNLRRATELAVKEVKDLHRGKLTLGANEYGMTYLLTPLATFHSRFPDVRVQMKRSQAAEIPTEVLARTVEMGVLSYRPLQTGLTVVSVGNDETVLIVSPNNRLAKRNKISMQDLGSESFIATACDRSPYRQQVTERFQKAGIPLNITMEMPTIEGVKWAVQKGFGIALVPGMTVKTEIEGGKVKALRVPEISLERLFYLTYRKGAKLSHAARAFLSIVQESRDQVKRPN
jgi:DNA-binding transcriptional LysR family regulator